MVEEGVELLAGVVQDPVFGPLVAFGPGGVLAWVIGEQVAILPGSGRPLGNALHLVDGGKAGRLVGGFRGRPAVHGDRLLVQFLLGSALADSAKCRRKSA